MVQQIRESFSPRISMGNLLTILVIVCQIITAWTTTSSNLETQKARTDEIKSDVANVAKDVTYLKDQQNKISIDSAVQSHDIKSIQDQLRSSRSSSTQNNTQ
jgi:septal ring factor EnvC (AmiA/AmiB activator)